MSSNTSEVPRGKTTHSAKVFISYSHEDKRWLTLLQRHMVPLTDTEVIDLWADTRLQGGEKWEQEIDAALSSAQIAILLVAPIFSRRVSCSSMSFPNC